MSEDSEVKAPVTRLRRRLSVEQSDDGKLSPALGTPTKKRGGRRAAKPELELIDENAAENNLKITTKKNIAKEVVESESEKPVTPSRRSARIKSNTSIVSDTVQNVNSPRAKRAARRLSQVGSDTEMTLTPARTRRTRKDSTSSIEKEVDATPTATKAQIPEVIIEEPDDATKSTKDVLKTLDNETTPIRKSPRLNQKKTRTKNSSTQDGDKNNSSTSNNESINTSESNKNDTSEPDEKAYTNVDTNNIKEKGDTNSDKNRLSVSSCNLIKNLEDKPKKNNSNINKSLSEAQDLNKIKSKRQRTKSWTTITNVSSTHEDFYSDNEIIKKKHQQYLNDNLEKKRFNAGSGDSNHNPNDEELNCSQNKISSLGKKKKRGSISETSNKESEVINLFKKDPSVNLQATIVMEDSDFNLLQGTIPQNVINEDQCVPVVDQKLETKGQKSPKFTLKTSFNKSESIVTKVTNSNNTCEPMDVDETLPAECLPNVSTKGLENQEKSLLHNTLEANNSMPIQNSNKSKRKSSTILSTSQNLEKSNNENKSTLVLSQLKDLSNSENKTPKISKNEPLFQSTNILNMTQENEMRKKNTQNYLTSTPLQQKADLGDIGKNKSNKIFDNNVSRNKDNVTPKKYVSGISNRSKETSEEDSESDEESGTNENSNLLDDEAEEASEDYESGDSQDEDERQYVKDNEIVEKGETLTSEDELSGDSDYEKDSFVVTSDDEDNELLSGSGDDLSMSDKELKMNPESKKKYNARKLTEQKQASREMYESRHKINTSKKDRKSTSSKIEENSRESLDSSDSTASDMNISKLENTDSRKKDKNMSKSSYNENILNEKEITITEETTENMGDPLALHVKDVNTTVNQQNMSIDFVDTDTQNDNPFNTITHNSKSLESKNPSEDSENETSSSLSTEDESITQNYNDMLNDLKFKTVNHSMSTEKKSKKKLTTPIVDHLNITQTKAIKTRNKSSQKENTTINSNEQNKENTENWSVTNYVNKCKDSGQNSNENEDTVTISGNKNDKNFGDLSLNLESKSKKKSKPLLLDQLNLTQGNKKFIKDKTDIRKSNNLITKENLKNDDSSDSIDLKLLFSEDSTNSSDCNKEDVKKVGSDADNFIPLKKVEAKTDIRASKDIVNNGNTDLPFFIDTIGSQLSASDVEIVNIKNTNKKTQKEESSDDDSNDEPLEISYKKEQNEKLPKKNKEESVDEIDHRTTQLANKSLLKTPPNDENKRKKSSSKNLSQIENISEKSLPDITLAKDSRMKNTSASFNVSNLDVLFTDENITEDNNNKYMNKSPSSEKKKMKNISQSNVSNVELNNTGIGLNKSISKNKKLSESQNSETFNLVNQISDELVNKQDFERKSIVKTPSSEKKKNKLAESENAETFNLVDKIPDELVNKQNYENKSILKTPNSEKKKKNLTESENSETFKMIAKISDESLSKQNCERKSICKTPKSEKKKKKVSETKNSETSNLADKISDESLNKQNCEKNETNQNKTITTDNTPVSDEDFTNTSNSQKRKRSSSVQLNDITSGDFSNANITANESMMSKKKKQKILQKSEENDTKDVFNPEEKTEINTAQNIKVNKTINSSVESNMTQKFVTNEKCKESTIHLKYNGDKNKKRKNRDDDNDEHEAFKIRKENLFDHIHISRLPPSVINKLDDKPNKVKVTSKKHKVISTTEFVVEETRKRRNKPSNYLEESIYLNDDESLEEHKKKTIMKKPKVLPFVPTASTSISGYTTDFKVNVLPQEIKFVAQSNNVNSFKNEYLYGTKIKRMGTYDLYKRNRNIKMSKF